MTTKLGFTKLSLAEFTAWINSLHIARTVTVIQEHHTLIPSYNDFNGSNHFELQQGMKNYHVNSNGWSDIGQHFTTFPDGSIMTGRSLERSPACIVGQNANSICIENLGNFDLGKNSMTPAQRETIIALTAALCIRFSLSVNSNSIVYHHWFNLDTGERNNGTKNNKSCPGTNFFGGNKVVHCEANFLPLISQKILGVTSPVVDVMKYVSVTTDSLNVRTGCGPTFSKADRAAVTLGSVLRIYEERDFWLKISNSKEYWVSAKYTTPILRATVTADSLYVRTGPDKSYTKVSTLTKGQELFIEKEQNKWCKLNMEPKWVSKDFLKF